MIGEPRLTADEWKLMTTLAWELFEPECDPARLWKQRPTFGRLLLHLKRAADLIERTHG